MINTLSQARALFDCIEPMEPFPTIRLTRQEMERAALDGGFYNGKNDHAALWTTLQRLLPQ